MINKLSLGVLLALLVLAGTGLGQQDKQRFHSSPPGQKIDYGGLFDQAQDLSASSKGQTVLSDCLEAYGGPEKLTSLEGFRIKYDRFAKEGSEPTKVVKSFQRGRRYRTVRGVDTRLINNLTCWYEHEDQVVELDGTRYLNELFSYLTLAMPLAAETERFDDIRFGKRDDDPLDYLYFDKADSVMIILGIDPGDNLVKSSTGIVTQGEQEFIFINEFSDHKEFDGFLFPEKTVYFSLGMRMSHYVVREIEINPVFKAGEFYPRNKVD